VGSDIFTLHSEDYFITVDYLSGFFEIDRLPSKRVKDIIHALKANFARHGIPSKLVTDNSPFGSQEFANFSKAWEFTHTTISPPYSQSKGRVESAVKTAKTIMSKALEANADPFLSLLEWRNTPSSQLHSSPVQILFGRRMRTRLPIASTQLTTNTAPAAAAALGRAKDKQAYYYNRTARNNDHGEWERAEVIEILPHRSYELRMENGAIRRRTSRHIPTSKESLNSRINDDIDDSTHESEPSFL